jgi:hypothetical protein
MAMTPEDIEKYDRNYIHNPPKNFADLSTDERRAWVVQEMCTGDYEDARSLPVEWVLAFGSTSHEWSPEYFMYLALLARFDPVDAAPHIRSAIRAVFFVLAYGVELAAPHVPANIWLAAMNECPFTPEEVKARHMILLLLKSRGADLVIPFIKGPEFGLLFVEIFGFESISLLPDKIANKVKGKLLENELGL